MISENADNHSCIFEINVIINFEMYSVFMSYGAGIKILSPAYVVEYMRNQLNAARELYDE
jgi:predicted DNA-binding transcriptional regulator YafY